MTSDPNELLISIPFGDRLQIVNSPRYSWNNATRGSEPFVILQWTLEGTGSFALETQTWTISAGEAFLAIVPEQSSYCFPKNATEPWKFAWVNFYGSLAISLARQFRTTFGSVVSLPQRSAAGAMLLKLAETRNAPDPYESSSAGYAFLMQWTRQLTQPMRHQSDPVETAIALCASRFREPIGIKELAQETGLTREHFTRIFTLRTGKPPARYLRDLRLQAALEMIRSHEPPLKEVALRCGFPSVRSLRQAMGC